MLGVDMVKFRCENISESKDTEEINNYPDWVNSCITAATSLTSWVTGIGSCNFHLTVSDSLFLTKDP